MDAAAEREQRLYANVDWFGRNAIRFMKGVLAVLLLLALVYLYYHYK